MTLAPYQSVGGPPTRSLTLGNARVCHPPTPVARVRLRVRLGKVPEVYASASNFIAAPPRICSLSGSAIDSASTCRAHSRVPMSKG